MFKKCKKCRAKTIRLNTIINGSTFDDVIRQEHGMEMERLRSGKEIKKVYLDSDGNFYCHEKAGNRFIKMNSLNLSWVPNDFFQIVLAQAKKRSNEKARTKTDLSQLPTLGEIYNKRYYRKLRLSKLEPFINKAKQLVDRYV